MRGVYIDLGRKDASDMSSSSVDNDSGTEETINDNKSILDDRKDDVGNGDAVGARIVEFLQEERDAAPATPQPLGDGSNPYKAATERENEVEDVSAEVTLQRPASPIDSLLSIPDDTPSVQVSS